MISTRILKPAAPSDGRNNCVATTRRSAKPGTGSCGSLRLPAIAYDACDKRPGRVSSLSLVRYRGTDYSVPTRFGHCEVLVRGYVHEVVIGCAAEVIARHPRSYEQEDFVFDPLHYLSLLEQKTNRWIRRLPWPAGCCRRCSAISAAYLKRGWAKPGSGNTSRCRG